MKSSCNIISGDFYNINRISNKQSIIEKNENSIDIVYFKHDTLEGFETKLTELAGSSSSFFSFKKKFSSTLFSVISVFVILFALISSALYEDLAKKFIYEYPFELELGDYISFVFVLVFFIGLIMMPSILDGERTEFRDLLQTWFNKDARILKRLRLNFKNLDSKLQVNIYNADLLEDTHWFHRLIIPVILNRFVTVNFYVRNDQTKRFAKRLASLGVLNCQIINNSTVLSKKNISNLLTEQENTLFKLMQLSSTNIIAVNQEEKLVSLEVFEYCARNFIEDKQSTKNIVSSGFQNFINRSFDDFLFLCQLKSNQIKFTNNVQFKTLDDEKRRLSYFLRNHIEECLEYFDSPISLLILYYYVKDIVLDEKRLVLILERLIYSIKKKQQYDLINKYWFDIAGYMFDFSNLDEFETSNNSIYRKLSIKSLDTLIFLLERNGEFKQALKIAKYLYEINPSKYSIAICSLYERMGEFDKAYNSLESKFLDKSSQMPCEIEIRHYQRKAWIIVSQRREADKLEGEAAISKLEELLFSHKLNNEPLWLWHYYNIKANYDEWSCKYESAIANYIKCLSIAALGAFEYGATFVNMAIAKRFLFLQNTNDTAVIEDSIRLGNLGVILKQSVGDRDEMPVVLHNQALNILYKILYSTNDESQCQNIINITSEAISILDSTGSIKRLGMLLMENIIAKELINKNNDLEVQRLENHMIKLDNNEKTQVSKLYNDFKAQEKIKNIEFLLK